jgi:putative oxidoreductase
MVASSEVIVLHRFLSSRSDAAYTLLRVVAGLMFSFHGMQKIFGLFAKHALPPAGSLLWFAGIIELVAGLLIAAGVLTTIAAFLASGEMAVAYVQAHWKLAFDSRFFPAINQGELALLYSTLFLFIATHGSGKWSLEKLRR